MQKKIELLILLLLIAGLSVLNKNLEKQVTSDKITVKENVVVIDAGHGGADPGKVGIGDILEKDINLKIARKVEKLLEKKRIQVIMTREDDTMLTGEGSAGTKAADMKARVSIINETAPKLAVSINQNSYEDPEVWGAQVFYYENSSEGERAAQIMQSALLSCNEDNKRQAKANNTYYLLKRTEIPTIIVECGFLTNPQESEKLCDETYQQTLAEAICKGILEYLGKQ